MYFMHRDAPARSFIKCIKSHNAYYGCDRCIQQGEWSGRVIFPVTDAEERTDYSFRNLIQKDHHKSRSPLIELEIDMIHSFPQDYMHLILLGVMRKLISFWRLGDSTHWKKLSCNDVDLIDVYLLKSRQYWCSDFNRKPRSLCSADRWKATEYRSFLLYLGPICLKSVLPKGIYYHFLLLFCAVSILVSDKLHQSLNDYAHSYLRHFCELADRYYGKEFLVYNVHSLIHISKDALHFGPLDTFSCFNFENFLGSLKEMLSKTNQPLQQVVKRIMEKNTWEKDVKQTPSANQTLSIKCSKYPSEKPNCGIEGISLTKVQCGKLSISTKRKDSCVITEKENVFIIENIVQTSDKSVYLIGKKYTDKRDFFKYPCHSSELNIYRVKKLKTSYEAFCMTSVRMKAVLLPYKNDFVCMPMRQTETWKDDL